MFGLVFIPCMAFLLLLAGETLLRRPGAGGERNAWDWLINLTGFAFQGAIIPLVGYALSTVVLPAWLPGMAGVLKFGWLGAFLLNFVFIDFLFYWQHRWFHRLSMLWPLHECHHTARRVDVWVTARNSIVTQFLFVYLLVNPWLGFLVDVPEAFYAGAMLTASLDLLRHAYIDYQRLPGTALITPVLARIFVLPHMHHQHHSVRDHEGNFGANLILWDSWFGTRIPSSGYPDAYGVAQPPAPPAQLFYPLARSNRKSTR